MGTLDRSKEFRNSSGLFRLEGVPTKVRRSCGEALDCVDISIGYQTRANTDSMRLKAPGGVSLDMKGYLFHPNWAIFPTLGKTHAMKRDLRVFIQQSQESGRPAALRRNACETVPTYCKYGEYPIVLDLDRLVPRPVFTSGGYFRLRSKFPIPESAVMGANIPDGI